MRQPRTLYEMQLLQRQHDEKNHHDIDRGTSIKGKMNHYVHHFGKYAGRLVDEIPEEYIKRELIATEKDMFLITLSAANALNIDLDKRVEEKFKLPTNGVLSYSGYKTFVDGLNLNQFREWTMRSVVRANGPMHDALEKMDHLETMVKDPRSRWDPNYKGREKTTREALEYGVVEWTGIVLIGLDYLGVDLTRAVDNRRTEIARKRVL